MSRTEVTLWMRRATDSLLGACFGALVYALWAVAVNWSSSPELALRAGAAHWVMSTFLTYYGTALMRLFYGFAQAPAEAALIAAVSGLTFTYGVLISVHYAVGTPHIALTLAAGVVPNLLFCGGYSLLLMRTTPMGTASPVEGVR